MPVSAVFGEKRLPNRHRVSANVWWHLPFITRLLPTRVNREHDSSWYTFVLRATRKWPIVEPSFGQHFPQATCAIFEHWEAVNSGKAYIVSRDLGMANSVEPLKSFAATLVNRYFFHSRHSSLLISMSKIVERLLDENSFLNVTEFIFLLFLDSTATPAFVNSLSSSGVNAFVFLVKQLKNRWKKVKRKKVK